MFESFSVPGGTPGLVAAVLIAIVFLGGVLFVGGKPNDVATGSVKGWLIGGLVVIALIVLLSYSMSNLTYQM